MQQAFFNSSQGPQHREFQKEILQAMRVGVWAPTQKLTKSQLTIMCKLGWDNEINFVKISFLSHSRVLC
ncbi:Nitrogen regulation protein NIFR3 [Staphylococcus aureus subsp. aureus DR10]|uniref:Nitrogen regulation protein NIFR3 n=1 Tax=Staphylococcus aureus subsp. aureus DR10 TaxID=1155079 RepID=A0ABC9PY75_STAA5|nr:Nitrogen regulation protein NIFR3 [Staphylococcus aureus subsp. aureus 71193]EIA13461.1 Nitrogen regulation protein NIFR3 [Staphylococcus aureus subsp. aureus DR10]